MTAGAPADFRQSDGWKARVDVSVALIERGEDIDNVEIKGPVVGFVFSNKGLMYNLTLEGSKFTRLSKQPRTIRC